MKFLRSHVTYPKDRDLVRVVNAAASRVEDLLTSLDANALDISDGAKQILQDRSESLLPHIDRCAHVFAWALPPGDMPFTDLGLVAVGDSLGVLALLAKECSIGTVIHADTDDLSCCDARRIATTVGCPADHYVFGDIEDVQFYVVHNSVSCDVFVSCDGIEVVEKPEAFFRTLFDLSDEGFSFGLSVRMPDASDPSARCAPDPHVLRDTMVNAGFRVELRNGCPVVSPAVSQRGTGERSSGRAGSKSPFVNRLIDITVAATGQRASKNGIGSNGSFVLCGTRPSGLCPHGHPARNGGTAVRPLTTSEIFAS